MRIRRASFHVISSLRFAALLALISLGLCFAARPAYAQLPQNRLYSIFPMGGQVGTQIDLTLANSADGDEVDRLIFSHPGITAEQKTHVVNGVEDPIANQFQVRIDEEVPPGIYDVRSVGYFGVSNPRSFVVGTRKETQESEANNTPETATAIEQNMVVNARSGAAGDIDFYKFTAQKGQRLIIDCWAKRIDSRMEATLELYGPNQRRLAFSRNERRGDPLIDFTIPEDGEYRLRVYDFLYAGNNDYFYRLCVGTGPHIEYILPPSGVPGTTGEFTLYGQNLPGGQPTGVEVRGQELQKLTVKIPIPADATSLKPGTFLEPYEASVDGFTYRLPSPDGPSNPILIHYADAAPQMEQEPNDSGDKATKLAVPGEATGQFQVRNDTDYYQFEAKSNTVYWIEVFGQRLGTFADPMLIVEQISVDKEGKESTKRLTAQDDDGSNLGAQGFDTRTDDPVFRFQAPADGIYRVMLRDRYFESRGDPRFVYRLVVREAKPDFRLVALPRQPVLAANVAALPATWDLTLRKGGHTEIEVLAFRQDGFDEPIEVSVAGLPAGVTCPGATIGPGQTSTRLVLNSTEDVSNWVGPIQLVGKVKIDDPAALKSERDARAAFDTAKAAAPAKETAVADANTTLKTAQDALAAQSKKAADADAVAKQKEDAAKVAQAELSKAEAVVKTTQQNVTTTTQALTAASETFVNAAVNKATADRNVIEAAKQAAAAVEEKLAAQQAKDQNAEVAADQKIVATAVASKQAADAQTAAEKEFNAAVTAKDNAVSAKAAAEKSLADASATQQKMAETYAAAMKAAADAAALAKQETAAKTEAEKAVAQATETVKAATTALAEAKKQLAAAEAAWQTAQKERDAKAQKLNRVARGGTIVWTGNQTLTATSRVARNLTLSVVSEVAPYQVNSDLTEITVSQGAQILAPIKLTKRSGFDNKVDLTVEGVPKNLEIEQKAIEKGQTEQLVRLFVKDNVKPGKYTIYVRGQGQVSYSRNPEATKRAEEEKAATTKAAAEAAELLKKSNEAKAAADQQAADAQAAATKAGEALAAADVALVNAQKAVEAAEAEKGKTEKSDADAAAKEAAAKKLTDAQAALQKAQTDRAAADKAAQEAAAALKMLQAVKNDADRAAAEADAKAKTAEAAKKAAEEKAAAAAKASKPGNVNLFSPSNTITITVKPAPVSVKAEVPNKGAFKKGAELKVPVTIDRKNGFTGPVTLTLPAPPGVAGLTAKPVTIPADQTKAELVITAAADATEGQLANLVIRATMNHDGETFVDAPVTLTVNK